MRTAEPLMVVVPHGVALEVEANVLNRDIGFVQDGDEHRTTEKVAPGREDTPSLTGRRSRWTILCPVVRAMGHGP